MIVFYVEVFFWIVETIIEIKIKRENGKELDHIIYFQRTCGLNNSYDSPQYFKTLTVTVCLGRKTLTFFLVCPVLQM